MLVSDIQVVDQEEYCELQAQVKFDTHWVWGDDPFSLWFRFPQEYKTLLNPENGDPFIPAFLVPAMVLGEPLEIQAPVSAKLLNAVSEIQTIYRCWDGSLSEVTVLAPVRKLDPSDIDPSSNVGLFFSMGLDSSYSLWKNIRSHPNDDESVTHLINVLGFDIYLWEDDRYPPLLANMNKMADALGKKLVPVTTNLRDVSDRTANWGGLYHGPALTSVALALGRAFRKIYIAASTTYSSIGGGGTHPLLDPLWGTEHLSFVHDGLEASRLDKTRLISQSPMFVENLRVCTTGELTDAYNCGKCEKCMRNMLALYAVGALQDCKTLPHEIDTDLLRSFRGLWGYQEALEAIGSSEKDLIIKAALAEAL